MSTKIVKAPTLPVALPEDDMPTVQTGPMMGAPSQVALEPGLQQGPLVGGSSVAPQAEPSGGLEPMTTQAPPLSQAPATDEFADIRPAAQTQTLIGLQDKSFAVAPVELAPIELPPLTPFADVPAISLDRSQAFTELDALQSLGKIHYEVGDTGRVKLFAPAFDVGFRHTSQSELLAKDHWFDFPEPSMAVETARLASWAFDKGIEQISHNGFFGDSGEGIDFGPKFPGDTPHTSTPAASQQTDAFLHTEATKPELPVLDQHPLTAPAAAPAAQAAPAAPLAPAAQTAPTAAPAAQAAPATTPAAQTAPATPPAADPAQPPKADASEDKSFLGSIAEKAGNAVRRFLQLDIIGVKGTNKETGTKYNTNLFVEYSRAPHQNFMRSSRATRQDEARQEQLRQERENQRAIDRELASNRLQQIALKRAAIQQEGLQKLDDITAAQEQPKPEAPQGEQKLHPAATGAFHSPFANLHAEKLFGQLDDAKKQGK